MDNEKMIPMLIYVPIKLKKKIEKLAEERKLKQSAIVRNILCDHFKIGNEKGDTQ